jgi:hypothetical protein
MIFVEIVCFLICAYLALVFLGIALLHWRKLAKFGLGAVLAFGAVALAGVGKHPTPDEIETMHAVLWIMGGCAVGLGLLALPPRKAPQ